jgi:hypothetical protein
MAPTFTKNTQCMLWADSNAKNMILTNHRPHQPRYLATLQSSPNIW